MHIGDPEGGSTLLPDMYCRVFTNILRHSIKFVFYVKIFGYKKIFKYIKGDDELLWGRRN